ncbi:MAG TPA: hypothetical protein VEL49_10665 [Ktedonobacteraceae bacterium]|nr:hypothetical protein [Ktedonobacteraceae bacterium]
MTPKPSHCGSRWGNLSPAQDVNVDWEQTHQISPPPQPDPPGTTAAETRTVTQEIMLQNMGDGVAFNVHSILYGPLPTLGFQYIS